MSYRRKTTRTIRIFLDEAESREACLESFDNRYHDALELRVEKGELVSPYPQLYARLETWEALDPRARHLMLMRGLAILHPSWVFCGVSAAVAHGLSVSYRLLGQVEVAAEFGTHESGNQLIRRRRVHHDTPTEVQGLPISSVARAALDVAREHGFAEGLAAADSALRLGLATQEDLMRAARVLKKTKGVAAAREVALSADGRSANGGESLARASMILLGYATPDLQVKMTDPLEPWKSYYADYQWVRDDGSILTGELDGGEKYVNPEMTHGDSTLEVMRRERRREARITARDSAVMRFSLDEALDLAGFQRLLELYRVPHAANW